MLMRIVLVLTGFSALAGLARVLIASKRGTQPRGPYSEKQKKQRMRGSMVLWLSVFAFLFVLTGYGTPLEIVLALFLCLAVTLPLTFIKGQFRFVSPSDGLTGPSKACDIHTGERLGIVVGQLREDESERATAYRIRTSSGDLIERAVDQVRIEFES
jgi:hypothetical protein